MKRFIWVIGLLLLFPSLHGRAEIRLSLDEIILDIYNAAAELSEVDYEQLQTDLYALHETPIDLNNTSDEELSRLYFLSPKQIDDILLYADKHPFQSLEELRLIPSLADYEIRDLLPFVRVGASAQDNKLYAREVFHFAKHEIITRVDARNIENFEGTDPMFTSGASFSVRNCADLPAAMPRVFNTALTYNSATLVIFIRSLPVIFKPLLGRVWFLRRFFVPANRHTSAMWVRRPKDFVIIRL